ncbi:hypothetical protein ROHU_001042 [Labeo rohita]|uniref:Uncharacterized protein n=1 Tax=Labeo rohita TaxID=84645 RepID=A0A498P4Z2_LABRO|nr:hypothetical protein ROHU_001042 [Labeo rohita]
MAAGGKMAAAACGAACGAATGRSKIRTKPEIYHTDTGQVIVEDELLNFLFVKLKTVKQDEIVLMATDCFGSEWIANSTKLLFELCPGSTRKLVAHTGPQKDSKNIRSCLKLLNEAGENVPRFVSHHLDELPPVTFNSLDVSCLLGKIEQLSVDITTMKQAVSLQTNTYNDLRIITTDINQRLSAIEQPRPNLKRGPVLQTLKPVPTQRVSTPQACEKTQDDMEGQTSEGDLSQMENSASGRSGVEWSDMAATPPWNLVQDKRSNNRRKQVHENASVKLKPRLNPHKGKKPAGIFGTGTGGDIQVIKSKLVSVFATKFSPDLDSETLTKYMKDKLGCDVTCQKLEAVQSRFSSFKITTECKEVDEMYNPELWPEGTFVRRFYEARKPKSTAVPISVMNVPVMGSGVPHA